jgi:CobQ-like glutamine amidotransferase family enzyme
MKQSSSDITLNILQLYPKDMNIYGDWGNVLTLKRRAEWQGFNVNIVDYNPGDKWPDSIDIVVGGGGQDSGQVKIHEDLMSIESKLKDLAEDDVPMLMICGLYQLFGHEFIMSDGSSLPGIGILDIVTKAGNTRLIGNITTESKDFGKIIGYENHSGQTHLGKNVSPLGIVTKGDGNNSTDKTEGARYRNVIGTYLHGSLLPKNPRLADWLLQKAIESTHENFSHQEIDDSVAEKARSIAMSRPR